MKVLALVEFNFHAFSSLALLNHLDIKFENVDFYYIGPDIGDKYMTIYNSLIFLGIDKSKINNASYSYGSGKLFVQKLKNKASLLFHLYNLKNTVANKIYDVVFSSFITKDVKVITPNKYLISLLKSKNLELKIFEISDGTRCIARNKGINPSFLYYKNIFHKFSSTLIYSLFGYQDNFIDQLVISSPFDLHDVDIKLDLSTILDKFNQLSVELNENLFDVLLIGQPLSEVNLMNFSQEMYYLSRIKQKFSNICYYPHPFDSHSKLKEVAELGYFVYKRDAISFEIFLIKNSRNFKSLLTYNSTAICFAKLINPDIDTLSYDSSRLISDYVDDVIDLTL